jgi:ubiquinone/menaquinone biosynthesis C-methylase UbiE
MAIFTEGPNAEQIQYWNEQVGPKWVQLQNFIDAQIRPLGEIAIDRAGLKAGERVLDVGCGCGDAALAIAGRLGPTGEVVGIDISGPMLERARRAAQEAGIGNARFEHSDAQTHRFEPQSFDLAFSRFGVMFFADPAAAFANIRGALRPHGRLAFVCWRSLQENVWVRVPLAAALQHIPPPPIPPPDAPGPFAFADPDRLRDILARAGFADVRLEKIDESLSVAGEGGVELAAEFLVQMGPVGRILRELDDAAALSRVTDAVREALRPYATERGVRMPSAAWVVTANEG